MKISLRTKLVISFMVVIITCGAIVTITGMRLITIGVIRQAQDTVTMDLNTAREMYSRKTKEIKDVVRFTAMRFFIKDAILENNIERLKRELAKIRKSESLDILTFKPRNPSFHRDSRAADHLVSQVISERKSAAGTVIVSREELLKEGEDLADQACIKFISTPKAKPRPEKEESSGMMIKAAAPVFGYDGSLMGVLYGGKLLNRNYEIVDRVKDILYKGIEYKGKDIGAATVFQKDLRISTNVKTEDGNRAIGTRVSGEVYEQVLVKGLCWRHRAFVVNNWYIAAYEPIKDIKGDIVGMLYVGILEEKFVDMKKKALVTFLGITFAGMVIVFVVAYFLANGILGPIKSLIFASRQWARGNLEHRVKIRQKDEIGELGETFNLMASSLRERDEKLREYTERQIMRSEKLATLGQLAAGVAHEINNPLGAVLMYLHLGLEDLESKETLSKNLQKAAAEATRCKDIVQGLLDFSRQSEPRFELNDVNEVLRRTFSLIKNQSLFQNVKINKTISFSFPKIMMDASQIQQVFTNIVLNAAEAMEGRGLLTIAAGLSPDQKYIEIEFIDTGCGIPQESLDKIFDPFFTKKKVGHGTGLGLAVSYGIILRHKGSIEAKSEEGKGTAFIVRLPLGGGLDVRPG